MESGGCRKTEQVGGREEVRIEGVDLFDPLSLCLTFRGRAWQTVCVRVRHNHLE